MTTHEQRRFGKLVSSVVATKHLYAYTESVCDLSNRLDTRQAFARHIAAHRGRRYADPLGQLTLRQPRLIERSAQACGERHLVHQPVTFLPQFGQYFKLAEPSRRREASVRTNASHALHL